MEKNRPELPVIYDNKNDTCDDPIIYFSEKLMNLMRFQRGQFGGTLFIIQPPFDSVLISKIADESFKRHYDKEKDSTIIYLEVPLEILQDSSKEITDQIDKDIYKIIIDDLNKKESLHRFTEHLPIDDIYESVLNPIFAFYYKNRNIKIKDDDKINVISKDFARLLKIDLKENLPEYKVFVNIIAPSIEWQEKNQEDNYILTNQQSKIIHDIAQIASYAQYAGFGNQLVEKTNSTIMINKSVYNCWPYDIPQPNPRIDDIIGIYQLGQPINIQRLSNWYKKYTGNIHPDDEKKRIIDWI